MDSRKDAFPGGATGGGIFQHFFYGGVKSGEICFSPLETKKTIFFSEIFKIQNGKAPLSDARGTIPFVSVNQEKSWKHRFCTFSKHMKSTKSNPLASGPLWISEQGCLHCDFITKQGNATSSKLFLQRLLWNSGFQHGVLEPRGRLPFL